MKKRTISLLLALLLIMSMILPAQAAEPAAAATGIAINQTRNLAVGDSKPLILSAVPEGADLPAVTWSSSNTALATVDQNGIVTGVKAGRVTITATATADSSITASVELLVRSKYNYNVEWAGTYMSTDNNAITSADLPADPQRVEKVWGTSAGNGTMMIMDGYVYTYDGTSFTGSTTNSGTLYKIDKETGEIVSTMVLDASTSYYYAYIIYGGGLIYIGTIDKVLCIDPDSFTLLWTAAIPSRNYGTIQFAGNCVIADGTVLDSTTGARIKTLPGSYSYSAGVEKDGVFYIACREGRLYAFNTSDWSQKAMLSFRSSTAANQPGVCFLGGNLFWGENGSKAYSVQLASDGGFVSDSLKSVDCGVSTNCTPVAANGRVYIPGAKDSQGVIGVFRASDMSLLYVAGGAREKIQSTPIARVVTGGAVVSSEGAPQAEENSVTVYVQDYAGPSSIWMLKDTGEPSSGSLQKLVTLDPQNYAYEQLAADKSGALYAVNDSGVICKYRTSKVSVPTITTDLSTTEKRYTKGADAEPLVIAASVNDGGSLSSRWQSRTETGDWSDISGATTTSWTPSTAAVGTIYYRCIVTNTLLGETAQAVSKIARITVVEGTNTDLTVTVRVIGASPASGSIDFAADFGSYKGSEYATWIPTTTFHVSPGTTVKQLISTAVTRANEAVTFDGVAVLSVKAPASLGGFTLANGANGDYALWMLAVNGNHSASYEQELADGDALLLHYANDYRYEIGDQVGSGDQSYVDHWLQAPDTAPAVPADLGDVNGDGAVNGKDVTMLSRTLARWVGYTVETAKADVNGDGAVNSKDVTVLKRYLARWEGVRLG